MSDVDGRSSIGQTIVYIAYRPRKKQDENPPTSLNDFGCVPFYWFEYLSTCISVKIGRFALGVNPIPLKPSKYSLDCIN